MQQAISSMLLTVPDLHVPQVIMQAERQQRQQANWS